jgi:hypothetical protein
MPSCDVCGNEYEGVMQIRVGEREGVYDSFECAIHALAPTCEHCGCRILGHGHQAGERMFCCAHCARASGVEGLADSAP